ncbi:MAG: nucleotidyl transferase AbiEii/AbiGii toxin family protein [Methylotenera sp.]|nr:nucleotidyl transferase AbiEii/AbiGii toxin family protein [Methylococcaceae bacterium]MDP3818714.1 nucleotidyl transferase AbiEii/AbiGii toxin family protein [Methylotenera sp.]
MKQEYLDTVRLLIDIAPTIFKSPRFAMKGGTAINLFLQDMPRLSVDIDIVFTDHTLSRNDALTAIVSDLNEANQSLQKQGFSVRMPQKPTGEDVKLFVQNTVAEVKIEVNHVFRGTLLPTQLVMLSAKAMEVFTSGLSVPTLHGAEIYGSKLVAAMDRQHPRDIFDVLKMNEKFGLDSKFVDCFVAYLAGHNRPIHEVLFSKDAPLETLYKNHFVGMTTEEVSLETLIKTRSDLKINLPKALTQNHKDFLLSLVSGEPAWELMPFEHLKELPALKWKLENLAKLKSSKKTVFQQQYELLSDQFKNISQ